MWQPEGSRSISRDELAIPLARSFAAHIQQACGNLARLLECRRLSENGAEIVTFEMDIGVPQRPVYAINPVETVSVGFWPRNESAPVIAVTRADFPDTPHQNLAPEGLPSFLCVDDRPWQDIRSGYTASELAARIQIWFEKACEGALHGDDQPFDPIFANGGRHQLIITSDGAEAMAAEHKLSIWRTDDQLRFLLVTGEREGNGENAPVNVHMLHVRVEPKVMIRLRRAPGTLHQLSETLTERGCDLVAALKASILDWLPLGKNDADGSWLTCIMISMPQIHPRTGEIGETKPMAFISDAGPGAIGEAPRAPIRSWS